MECYSGNKSDRINQLQYSTVQLGLLQALKEPLGSWVCSKWGPSSSQENQQEFWHWYQCEEDWCKDQGKAKLYFLALVLI